MTLSCIHDDNASMVYRQYGAIITVITVNKMNVTIMLCNNRINALYDWTMTCMIETPRANTVRAAG